VATALASAKTTDRARRVTETTAAVAIWIALGFACHMTVSQYQLTGVVLVFLFQLFVRRKPLQALWLRDAPAFRLDGWGWALALVLAADPIFHVVKDLRSGDSLFRVLAHTAAVAGALPAAFVFRRFDRATARAMLLCLGFPGSLGTCMMLVSAFGAHHLASRSLAKRLLIWGDTILLYLPILFVFEEVSFRGAFDSHLQHPGEPHPWLSALWISVLWGLWHVPVTLGTASLPIVVLNDVIVSCLMGVPLSMWWRRTGNLAVPGVTHAFVDAVRNALMVISFR